MPNFVDVQYPATGASKAIDALGMRPMQSRAFDARGAQYLLVKSPPASGKSRALMFIAIDKLKNQGLRKAIIAVPERSIGGSFRSTNLTEHGFFHDWAVEPQYDLCRLDAVSESGKIAKFKAFMADDNAETLVCTHATLRFAFDAIITENGIEAFDEALLAVDEFHHVSADVRNRLGEVVRSLMERDKAHIVAMTGSYFRGDQVPVMRPEDEDRFTKVVYTYYEQLSGYDHLKTLGIGYHFYHGPYTNSIAAVLDPAKKTIVHIPNVNSQAALKDKIREAHDIIATLGNIIDVDQKTGFYLVEAEDGRTLRVADLVNPDTQQQVLSGLREVKGKDDLDVVVALGMAKEGFDWIWCEHALTVGYRGSLTELIQIIGRTTRDAPGKSHAQFTNLISEPDETEEKVKDQVNDMLKAIACSLLMEQVLAPNFNFKTKLTDDTIAGEIVTVDTAQPNPTLEVKGLKQPTTDRGRDIINTGMDDLLAAVIQEKQVIRASLIPGEFPPETLNQVIIPQVIQKITGLPVEEAEVLGQHLIARQAVLARLTAKQEPTGGNADDDEVKAASNLLRMTSRFLKMPELDIDLIQSMNPFMSSYEILSKAITESVLRRIHASISETRIEMSEAEALAQIPRIREFQAANAREPDLASVNPIEKRMAEALAWIRAESIRRQQAKAAEAAA